MSAAGIVYETAWRAIDDAIVRGLRRSRGPVRDRDIAHRCCISHLCNAGQLAEALERLVGLGLIRRVPVSYPDPRSPLLATVSYTAYEAVEGVAHGDR